MSWPESFTHFRSPFLQWQQMPTFLIGEYLFFLLTLVSFIHAIRNGSLHQLIWWASLLTGTVNDIFFMALPVVDNFWQAQATVMITPRLPLYIPCVYICFMYYSVVGAWHLSLKPVQTAVLAGVLALLFYGPYDILGAKFLWWTWHATDAPIRERLLGVPIGSSMWILTFVFSFSLLLQVSSKKNPHISLKQALICLGICCALTTPLMLAQMTVLGFLNREHIPSVPAFLCLLILYALLFLLPFFYGKREGIKIKNKFDNGVAFFLVFYYIILFSIVLFGHPEKHVSIGVHQTVGPCHAIGVDISGNSRNLYLCKKDSDLAFTIEDDPFPTDYENWYTVYGKPYFQYIHWFLGMLFYCFVGSLLYGFLYTRTLRRS